MAALTAAAIMNKVFKAISHSRTTANTIATAATKRNAMVVGLVPAFILMLFTISSVVGSRSISCGLSHWLSANISTLLLIFVEHPCRDSLPRALKHSDTGVLPYSLLAEVRYL